MAKMWAGRTDGATDRLADDFNSSIGFDSRMFRQDIRGSMAHAAMLPAMPWLPTAFPVSAPCGSATPMTARAKEWIIQPCALFRCSFTRRRTRVPWTPHFCSTGLLE